MSPVAFEIFGREIFWYGIIISTSVMVSIYLGMRNAKFFKLNPELIVDLALIAVPLAIIGARVYYVIFEWERYRHNLISIINIGEGGLAIYGAVLAGIGAGIFFARWKKIEFWNLADICIPSVILGQAIGRWGNFFNQEAFGRAVINPAWQWFPASVFIEAQNQWHMATFFYESAWNFMIFFFLMAYRKKRQVTGELFLFYLMFYGIGRMVIEGLRTDSLYWGPFRVSQILSAVLIIIGVTLFIIRRNKAKKEALVEVDKK